MMAPGTPALFSKRGNSWSRPTLFPTMVKLLRGEHTLSISWWSIVWWPESEGAWGVCTRRGRLTLSPHLHHTGGCAMGVRLCNCATVQMKGDSLHRSSPLQLHICRSMLSLLTFRSPTREARGSFHIGNNNDKTDKDVERQSAVILSVCNILTC